jgi:hypothetical protein
MKMLELAMSIGKHALDNQLMKQMGAGLQRRMEIQSKAAKEN